MGRYTVRLLSPTGIYPVETLGFVGFAALVSEDLVWSVVYDPPEGRPEHLGEISWLSVPEIRFFSAVSLAERHPFYRGRVRIHTVPVRPTTVEVPESEEELFDGDFLLDASREAAHRLAEEAQERGEATLARSEGYGLDRDYHDEVSALLDALDFQDPLLHRGLYKLLMATELIHYPQFLEEAGLSAFISREAALELLRRKLTEERGSRAKKEDVFRWIRTTFPTGDSFTDVLKSDWEARILMVHPISEYGEYWSPPIMAGECFQAIHSLTYLYRFLLLDDVPDRDASEEASVT